MASAAATAVKVGVYVYDAVSLPFYFLGQRPWETWKKRSAAKVGNLREGDPSGPYYRKDLSLDPKFMQIETVDQLFRNAVAEHQDKPCFGVREVLGEEEELQPNGKKFKKLILGDYKWITYNEAEVKVNNAAKGFLSLGVKPKTPVVIFAETKLEWMIAAQALFRIGAPVATLYATLGEDAIVHGLNETEVSCMVTSQELLPKLQNIISKVPKVKTIIYIESHKKTKLEGFPADVNVMPFSKLEETGTISDIEVPRDAIKPDDVAVIMYTSGSTGVPKGVMISNKNIISTVAGFAAGLESFAFMNDGAYLGYLPLAHMMEFAAECLVIANGFQLGYSSPQTMTDKSTAVKRGCKGDATILRPAFMAGVPLVLDRIRKSIDEAIKVQGPFAQELFEFAIRYKKYWHEKGFNTPLLDKLIFGKIRQLVGGNLKVMFSGGAPLSPETHDFIRICLGCQLIQGYALTETTASATTMDLYDTSSGRVGMPLPGAYIKLRNWEEGGYRVTDKPNPRGEVIIGGPGVTLGYFKRDDLTKEAYREEDGIRWFDSGDIGEIFPDGSLKIIDRKKDLVKLQFGEYISLGKVESELKTCPLVDNICVYGNSFQITLVAIVVPNHKQLVAFANEMGKTGAFEDLIQDPKVVMAFKDALTQHGIKNNLLKVEIPAKIKLVSEEWTPDNGMVTAALKIRRQVIYERYKNDINNMYGIEANGTTK